MPKDLWKVGSPPDIHLQKLLRKNTSKLKTVIEQKEKMSELSAQAFDFLTEYRARKEAASSARLSAILANNRDRLKAQGDVFRGRLKNALCARKTVEAAFNDKVAARIANKQRQLQQFSDRRLRGIDFFEQEYLMRTFFNFKDYSFVCK